VTAAVIDSIELRTYRLPLDPPFPVYWDPEPRRALESTVVRVRAGEYEGVGSGDAMAGFAGNEQLFLGHDAFDIDRHARVLDSLQFHYGRMWPLEVALWDLMGKARDQPLWRMLGGTTSRVRVYASTGARVSEEERVASAVRLRDEGFAAIKLRFFFEDDPAEAIGLVRSVRDAVGSNVELLVDANQGWRMPHDVSPSWTFETALGVAKALAELGVYWLEEPLHRHDVEGLAALRRQGGLRIAGGEGARDLGELRQYLRHQSLDVYQPDVAWSTGVTGARAIAAEAASAGAIYTPHTWGDGLVLRANLHVAAACSNAPFVEYAYDPPWWTPAQRDFILPSPVVVRDGWVDLGDAPGLGIALDWDALDRWRVA
jgi:L-alanine-DL-glutamate epimerase-like enolase superfamily enzyme